jgi:hypothetical protein
VASNPLLLQEFDLEMRFTRNHLERVPEGKSDWKPHEKSMSLGWLSTFIAILPTWGSLTIEKDSLDPTRPGEAGPQPTLAETRKELLELFDRNVAAARSAIAKASDEHLSKSWTLLNAGKVLLKQPRMLVWRTYFLNHLIHHRAQLGVYLRLNDIDVPAVYSDSADEKGGMFMEEARSA